MSTTLSYGFVAPDNGDTGTVFFPVLRADIVQLNGHSHDGINSAKLTSASITTIADTTSIVAANWIATTGGMYRMIVTTPASIAYDDYGLVFQITNGTDTGARVTPTTVKISNTQYYVYCNDSTVNMTVLYTI